MNLYPQGVYYFGTDEIYSFHIRKLRSIATLIDTAVEVEDFQAIGVQCRETLIELGNHIYTHDMAGEGEQPQASNFKKKSELSIQFYLKGSGISDYRSIIKN